MQVAGTQNSAIVIHEIDPLRAIANTRARQAEARQVQDRPEAQIFRRGEDTPVVRGQIHTRTPGPAAVVARVDAENERDTRIRKGNTAKTGRNGICARYRRVSRKGSDAK